MSLSLNRYLVNDPHLKPLERLHSLLESVYFFQPNHHQEQATLAFYNYEMLSLYPRTRCARIEFSPTFTDALTSGVVRLEVPLLTEVYGNRCMSFSFANDRALREAHGLPTTTLSGLFLFFAPPRGFEPFDREKGE